VELGLGGDCGLDWGFLIPGGVLLLDILVFLGWG